MSSAVRFAPSQTPPATGAARGGPRTAFVPAGAPTARRLRALGPAELALTATLFSVYVGVRGSARLLGAIEGFVQR